MHFLFFSLAGFRLVDLQAARALLLIIDIMTHALNDMYLQGTILYFAVVSCGVQVMKLIINNSQYQLIS